MPNGRELQNVTPPGGNGGDPGVDPKIVKMAEFLDRAIRTQNTTVGIVTAAIGILLGRKGESPEKLERMIKDVSSAMRVGFFLHTKGK